MPRLHDPHFPLTAVLVAAAALQIAVAPVVHAQPSGRVAYLVDFASNTLDLVDLEHGTSSLGLLPVGIVPNQIEVRGNRAFVVNSFPENLQIIDLSGPTTTATVTLNPGSNPWAVEIADHKAYVTLWGSNEVAVIDLVSNTVTDVLDVGIAPEGMCLAGTELYVANSGFIGPGQHAAGSVTVINTATDQVTCKIPVGLNAQWCAVNGQGEVAVVCSDLFAANNGRVFIIDPTTHTATDSLRVGGFPGPIAINSSGIGWMVEYGAGLLAVDTIQHTVLHDAEHSVDAGGLGAIGLGLDAADRIHVALSADGLLTVVGPDGQLEDAFTVGPAPADVALYEAATTAIGESAAPDFPEMMLAATPNPAQVPVRLAMAVRPKNGAASSPSTGEVTLFNAAGRVVRRLYEGPIAPGTQNLLWDGRDAGGRPLPAGVYLARVTAGRETQVTKFTLVR